MPRQVTVWTTEEIKKLFGIKTKGGVSYLAKQYGLKVVSGYTGDIEGLYYARVRRDLVRAMGEASAGVVEHDEWDRLDNCPVCGGFAIWKPATPDEISNLEIEIYNAGWPWLCVNGHNKESEE